jgi:hypothetical protein
MGNWIAKTWKPGFLSAIQAFVIAVIAAVMMTEENPLAVFSSSSALLSKLTESSTLAFIVMAAPVLMMFFWFTRAIWLTIEYLGVATIVVIVLSVVSLIYLERNYPDLLERSGIAGWFEPASVDGLRSFAVSNRNTTLYPSQPVCQRIECIGVGDQQDKPYLPPTPAMPPVDR